MIEKEKKYNDIMFRKSKSTLKKGNVYNNFTSELSLRIDSGFILFQHVNFKMCLIYTFE